MSEEQPANFKAIKLRLASPDDIHAWSHGEVTRPETINYRTQKPEKDGLFCEKTFGPTKDWECYCGKYKRIRYKGIICDKCGVEVTRSLVRRERMGHIDLASPVSHIWFLRGVPSKIGIILDMSVQNLEKVIYFANFIVTKVDEGLKKETLKQIDNEANAKRKSIKDEFGTQLSEIKKNKDKGLNQEKDDKKKEKLEEKFDQEMINNSVMRDERVRELNEAVEIARKELKELKPRQVISENKYQDLSLKYGHVFEADIGAEAIKGLLEKTSIDQLIQELTDEAVKASSNRKRRLIRRLKLLKSLKINKIRPEWMVLLAIPVIPPDLRPMVQLDGGRFAASDLNDLYRRVINRNNRLKRLIELNAPEVIQRNEKRMLQEAVDALIDNGARRGKTVTASTGQKRMLKSLADMLKGKQGRFRANLLGKRVDYSGRSVIVVGPSLKLNQCGIPKTMALELFKPFVISELIKREIVYNVRSATRYIESAKSEVWDILEDITNKSHVLLNRAPTLHRLGIQAFQPILIEGKAITIHPLVCPPFNADFDGDQMAVHVPLTEEAKKEAASIMISTRNILKPATGEPVLTPSQDIVLGCYYMTQMINEKKEEKNVPCFSSPEEAQMALDCGKIVLRTKIKVKLDEKSEPIITTIGRVIINRIMPKSFGYKNEQLGKKNLRQIISEVLVAEGQEITVKLLDDIKELSIKYLTKSGISWGMSDLPTLEKKQEIIKKADQEIEEVYNQFNTGLLTDEERRSRVIDVWDKVKEKITKISRESLDLHGPIYSMIDSGARGSWGQTTQMMGMKGLVINPAGETLELPVKGSFKEGFDVLEYFISTHGARKGLSDTALRTANAGYLTRRLVDVAQDVVVSEENCCDKEGLIITKEESEEMGENLATRIIGRVLLEDVIDPKTKKLILKRGSLVTEEDTKKIEKMDLPQVKIRSILRCRTVRGVCQKCYGYDLAYNSMVKLGTAVGIIAAQSIGEPGTQLTMRTFHTGGVAGQDITQGLPRVEELFEARPIKKSAVISEEDGKVEDIVEEGKQKIIKIRFDEDNQEKIVVDTKKDKIKVKDGERVKEGTVIVENKDQEIKAKLSGEVSIKDNQIIIHSQKSKLKEYPAAVGYSIWTKKGDLVTIGQQLTEGSLDLHELFKVKGQTEVQKYIIKEIQYIYSSQGQKLNDKHIETIVRQMFSREYIKDSRDTDLLPGEVVTRAQLIEANNRAKAQGGKSALTEGLLLGITKVSLSTDSFLSSASFQETARVLIDAAISGRRDNLRGLKENVIIGKLIPVGTGFRKS